VKPQLVKTPAFSHEHFNLYHYHFVKNTTTQTENSQRPIILIVYALVNRPTILNLDPKRSFIGKLCEAGCEVYLMDWGYPKPIAATLSLKNYALDFIDHAVEIILKQHQIAAINLMGICQGGVFSICYAAWQPGKVATLIPVVTPANFHTADNLITPRINFILTKYWVEKLGNFPGTTLGWFLTMLKPEHTLWNKFKRFLHIKEDSDELVLTLKMEQWIHDTPDHPGQVLIDFAQDFYVNNSFMKKEYALGNEKLSWSAIQMPLLNVYALDDHLVPASAAIALRQVVESNPHYEELSIPAGHIGLFVGRKSAETLPVQIKEWLTLKNI